MPIQIQEINDENESLECPLCMEPLEVDDINFFPCVCGYQVCRFCWHRIRTDGNGLCPACRTSYPENPVEFRPLTESDLQKIRQEKRQKEVQRRQKISDCRRHLASIRVLQKNLVFVVGLSQRLSDSEVLKRQDYFGKYGRILKIVVNTNTAYAGSQGPSASAYITYSRMEEALRAIQSVNNIHVDGRTLKASLGTTKYCSTYLKNQQCHKQDCMYLHELADEESSFTKEDMQAGKHQELEQRLIEEVARKEVETTPIELSTTSSEMSNTTTTMKGTNTRSCSTPWSSQQQSNTKTENSWLAGMPQTFEQGAMNKPQTEIKAKEPKSSPKTKPKKLSPRHAYKALTPTTETTDSSHASSECSSVATTPPPATNLGTQNQTTRLPSNLEVESTKETNLPESQTYAKPICEPDVADLPPTTKQEDTITNNQTLNERYPLEKENFVKVPECDSEFPTSTLLPPLYDNVNVASHERRSQPLLSDAIPIQSTNDWEAAFGFSKLTGAEPPEPEKPKQVADSGDNDFGFDPWVECSKGLADLMEKESAYNSMRQPPATHKPEFSQLFPPHYQVSQNFNNTTPGQPSTNHFGLKPSGFSNSFVPTFPQQQVFGSQMHHGFHKSTCFDSNTNSKTNFPSSPMKKLSDWQNGLRALLPSVNINFAMDGQSSNTTSGGNAMENMHQSDNMAGVCRLSPRNHFSPGQHLLGSGFEEPSSQVHLHSSFFPQAYDRNQSYFQNKVGLGSNLTDRSNSLAPPPGLSSSSFHNDPAIISSGVKASAAKRTPTVEETPHWMHSLHMLVETDSPTSLTPNMPVATHTNPDRSFSSWPSLPSAGAPLGSATQPPPGFQNRLTDNNTMDYAIRQSLLENQS